MIEQRHLHAEPYFEEEPAIEETQRNTVWIEDGQPLAQPRRITEQQWERYERYIAEIFGALGLDLETAGTQATPRRFLRALFDATEGYEGDPKLLTSFPTECQGGTACELNQIVEGPVSFYSLCEHHALPFYGQVYVGYIAHEQIIGLSKLTRLVRVWAKRFSVQERLGNQIADSLSRLVQPHGVAVYIEAHHLCMQMRGVRESHPSTRTLTWRGAYTQNPHLRQEFLDVCR